MKPLIIILTLAAAAGADEIIPVALQMDRYAETVGMSPFVLETKSTEVAPVVEADIFQHLFLRGIGKADGKDYVLIQRLGEERPMRFIGNDPGPDDIAVQSVVIGNTFRETRVVLKKGTKTGEVKFKEESLTSAAPPPQGMRQPMVPGQPQKPGAMPIPQPQIPSARPPQFGNMPTQVPRPQGAVPPPQFPKPSNVPQSPGSSSSKGRLRVIPN